MNFDVTKKIICSNNECSLKSFCYNYSKDKLKENWKPNLEKKNNLVYCSNFFSITGKKILN
jgi:hypothetical protein